MWLLKLLKYIKHILIDFSSYKKQISCLLGSSDTSGFKTIILLSYFKSKNIKSVILVFI